MPMSDAVIVKDLGYTAVGDVTNNTRVQPVEIHSLPALGLDTKNCSRSS